MLEICLFEWGGGAGRWHQYHIHLSYELRSNQSELVFFSSHSTKDNITRKWNTMQCFKCLYNCPKECWSKLSYISQRTQNRHQVYTENHCTKSLSYLTKYDHYVNFLSEIQSIIPSPCTVFFPDLQYILVENRKFKLYIWCFFLLNEDS